VNSYTISEPVTPSANNSAGIYQYGPDYSYFIQVRVGSAQQPFYMLLDTGAANTWLMGSDCPSDACKMHNTFDPSSSKTWATAKNEFSINYGSGDLTGYVGHDTASFAGLTVDLSFGLANYTHNDFKHFAFDGILGLTMSPSVTGTFLQTLRANKSVSPLIFSVSLNRDSDGPNQGQITFGGVDSTKYTGEIGYTNVPDAEKDKGEWAIPMGDLSFNGKSAGLTGGRLGYIDTGTSFVFAPPDDLAALFKNVPGASSYQNGDYIEYQIPCDTRLPIKIAFSGITYEISAEDWVVGKDDHCISRIYGYTIKAGTWLLGDTFLKNVYSVFDADKMRIGFASKPPPPPKTTSTSVSTATTLGTPATGTTSDSTALPFMPGGTGQETSAGTAETATSPNPEPTHPSSGNRLGSGSYVSIVCIAAVIAMAV
jgi:hypothetical protein